MSANAVQVGGDHYKENDFQPWDLGWRYKIGAVEFMLIKYVSRWRKKNGVQDLEKAQHVLMKLEEIEQDGYEPPGRVGPMVLQTYFAANFITDFREKIVISIISNGYDANQLNHAALLLASLVESARGEAQKS